MCFLRDNGGRFVLLPDGRQPPAGIDPHFAAVIVAPGAVEEAIGWGSAARRGERAFRQLPACSLTFEGADVAGTLDTSAHDQQLPQLKKIDPNFEIDPSSARTIARMHVRRGTLVAYAIPGGAAVMSQLEVPHDDSIHITVTPDDGSPERRLRFAPGTEIVLSNMAAGGYAALDQQNNHFRIYEVLSAQPVSLVEPDNVASLSESPSSHVLFTRATPIGLSTGCSNTGCCSP